MADFGIVRRPGGAPLSGADRAKVAADLKKKYDSGTGIRALAEEAGRSYSFVHRLLREAGTKMRPTGKPPRAASVPGGSTTST